MFLLGRGGVVGGEFRGRFVSGKGFAGWSGLRLFDCSVPVMWFLRDSAHGDDDDGG